MPNEAAAGDVSIGAGIGITRAIVRWCLYLVAIFLPIFILPLSWALISEAKILLLGLLILIALSAWFIGRFFEGVILIPRNILFAALSFLPIAYTVSALFSGLSISSFVSGSADQDTVVVVCLLYALFALVVFALMSRMSVRIYLVRSILAGIFILMLFQIGRLLVPSWLTLGGVLQSSATSIVGSWHDFGIVAGLTLIMSCGFLSTMVARGMWKWLLWLLGLMSVFFLVIVNSIDVFYTIAGIALLYALYRAYLERAAGTSFARLVRRVGGWLFLALVALSCAVWSTTIYDHLPMPLQIAQTEVRPSWQGTFAVGEKVLSGGSDLIFGSGPNTFMSDWSRFKPAGVNATAFWDTDFPGGVGIIPTAFITVGILGIIAWLLPCLGLLSTMVSLLRKGKRFDLAERSYTAAVLFATLYLMTFIVIYVPSIAVVAITFVFLGLLVACEIAAGGSVARVSVQGFSWKSITISVVLGILFALFVLAGVTALRATVSDLDLARAVANYQASPNIDVASQTVQQALAIFPQNDNAQRAAVELGLLKFSQIVATGQSSDAAKQQLQSTLSDTIAHGLAAVSINANDYQNWLELASLYQNLAGEGVQGAFDSAKASYQKAIQQNPTNPLIYVQFAQLEMAQNDLTDAMANLNTAISLKPDFPAAYYFRSQIEASQSNFPGAASDANEAVSLVPTDPTGWYNLGTVYYAGGSYQQAAAALEKAVTLQNNYANAMFLLGLSYQKLGLNAQALAMMQSVEQSNPGNASVESAITQLQEPTAKAQ